MDSKLLTSIVLPFVIGATLLMLLFDSDVSTGLMYFLIIISVLYLFKSKKSIFYEFDNSELILIFGFIFFTTTSVLWLLLFDTSHIALARNEIYAVFGLSIPILLYLRSISFDVSFFLPQMMFFVAILVFSAALYQFLSWNIFDVKPIVFFDNMYSVFPGRASGGINPIRFSAITLAMSAISVLGVVHFTPRKYRVYFSISAILLFISSILALSRGPMIAVPFLISFIIFSNFRLNKKSAIGFVLIISILGGLALSSDLFKSRIVGVKSNIELMLSGEFRTSIGARVEMAYAAVLLIKRSPVIGSGIGSYKAGVLQLRSEGHKFGPEVGMWKNPHNEFLNVLVEKGLFGFFTLIGLFAPLIYFYFKNRYYGTSESKFLSQSAMVIVIVYLISGQSIALFEHKPFTFFYILMTLLIFSAMFSHRTRLTRKF